MTQKDAARYVGISESSLSHWVGRGREAVLRIAADGVEPTPEEQPFVDILDLVERAKSQAMVNAVSVVQQSMGSTNPHVRLRAATWWLERTAPELYGRRDVLTIAGDPDAPVHIAVSTEEQEERTEFIIGELVRHGVVGELPEEGEIEEAELVEETA